MFRIVILGIALFAAFGCARKTGTVQIGPNQPAFQLNGDNLAINPQRLGLGESPELSFDTYSGGEVDLRLGGQQKATEQQGGAF